MSFFFSFLFFQQKSYISLCMLSSHSVVSDSVTPWTVARQLLCPWNFPGKNTGVGCHFPLQGLFLSQGLSLCLLCLLNWQVDSLPLGFLLTQMIKNLPTVQETQVWFLCWEDLLEKEMATHSNILAWRNPWTEEPDWLQSMGSQRVGHDWMTNTFTTLPISLQGSHLYILSPALSLWDSSLEISERLYLGLKFSVCLLNKT